MKYSPVRISSKAINDWTTASADLLVDDFNHSQQLRVTLKPHPARQSSVKPRSLCFPISSVTWLNEIIQTALQWEMELSDQKNKKKHCSRRDAAGRSSKRFRNRSKPDNYR